MTTVTKLEPIDGGDRSLVVDALREMADTLEAGKDSPPVGYAIVVARADGGVTFCWSGNEVRTIGALEYAKHTVISVWRELEEGDPR